VLAFAAIGSALGTGIAGMAAVGAWKKCFAQNKAAPFMLTVFVGAPLSQTIYGFILMQQLAGKVSAGGGSFFVGDRDSGGYCHWDERSDAGGKPVPELRTPWPRPGRALEIISWCWVLSRR